MSDEGLRAIDHRFLLSFCKSKFYRRHVSTKNEMQDKAVQNQISLIRNHINRWMTAIQLVVSDIKFAGRCQRNVLEVQTKVLVQRVKEDAFGTTQLLICVVWKKHAIAR